MPSDPNHRGVNHVRQHLRRQQISVLAEASVQGDQARKQNRADQTRIR